MASVKPFFCIVSKDDVLLFETLLEKTESRRSSQEIETLMLVMFGALDGIDLRVNQNASSNYSTNASLYKNIDKYLDYTITAYVLTSGTFL